jgi:hypothetical protein
MPVAGLLVGSSLELGSVPRLGREPFDHPRTVPVTPTVQQV